MCRGGGRYGGNGVDLPRQNKISIPRENAFRAGIYKYFALNFGLFMVGSPLHCGLTAVLTLGKEERGGSQRVGPTMS